MAPAEAADRPKPTDPDASAAAPEAASEADGADGTPPAPPQEPPIFVRNLVVLPPRQKAGAPSPPPGGEKGVPLPPLRPEEPAASLRGALGEVVGFAHLTRYRLVVERRAGADDDGGEGGPNGPEARARGSPSPMSGGEGSSDGGGGSGGGTTGKGGRKKKRNKRGGGAAAGNAEGCWSPFTLRDADVTVPPSLRSLEAGAALPHEKSEAEEGEVEEELVLDEYGDLSLLLPLMEDQMAAALEAREAKEAEGASSAAVEGAEDKIELDASHLAVRVVLERYDLAGVRDHVARVRQLLEGGNAPCVTSLAGDDAPGEAEAKRRRAEAAAEGDAEEEGGEESGETKKREESKEELEANRQALAKALPPISKKDALFELAMKGDLTSLYYLACGEEQTLIELQSGEVGQVDNSDIIESELMEESSSSEESESKENKKKGNGQKKKIKSVANQETIVKSNKTVDKKTKNQHPMAEIERTLYDLNTVTSISTSIQLSGYHPPPPHRRVLGDLAYLAATMPDGNVVHVTAFPLGFYVNRSTSTKFDPAPVGGEAKGVRDACYSHALLDALLQRSKSLRGAWSAALAAALERSELLREAASQNEDPLHGLLRTAISPYPNNCTGPAAASALGGMLPAVMSATSPAATFVPRLDSVLVRPAWLVPLPSAGVGEFAGPKLATWDHGGLHSHDATRMEDELTSAYGMDVRGGGLRDWNEELQSAREMPRESFVERMERARVVHRILVDFGDASLAGVKAILDGYILPMNPNEPARSHVYFHNNIFFSRAVDSGLDTFKIVQGDAAARKSASKDASNVGVLHRLDVAGLHTLATVLVEYLGSRIVCQSVVPGILHGEKSHSLLYGAVETLSALRCDKEMHELLERSIGEGCMVATRSVPAHPLTDERMEVVKKHRIAPLPGMEEKSAEEDAKGGAMIKVCGPVEMKGILGSDKRKYVLDCTRLTPRDANWVSRSCGGTGRWEDHGASQQTGAKSSRLVPSTLDDDEWTACVLRPELVTGYAEMKIGEHLREKKDDTKAEIDPSPDAKPSEDKKDDEEQWVNVPGEEKKPRSDKEPADLEKKEPSGIPTLAKAEDEYIRSLRYNVNVFLPFTRSMEAMDGEEHEQLQRDEEEARSLARHLWDAVIPNLTKEIRASGGNELQLPADGRSLTELIHQRGINCRYLGRLAELARKEELEDVVAFERAMAEAALVSPGSGTDGADKAAPAKKRAPRFRMPICWLELLECEMVARAAKHVLDSYMLEGGGSSSALPAQTIASFLSAVVSVGEESAAETERRTTGGKNKAASSARALDQEEMDALTLFGGGVDADNRTPSSLVRGRNEIWSDIEREIGRRYRYTLSLYNTGAGKGIDANDGRALYVPLLRRMCQRSGIRLVAKRYNVGKKCVCGASGGGGSGLAASYPISPTDILDILPLAKHAASIPDKTFAPCFFAGNSAAAGGSFSTSLHVLLSDAKTLYEVGHANLGNGNFAATLDYAQEASNMYQRVVDSPLHPQVSKCLKLTSIAHYHRDETELALSAAAKNLVVSISLNGFDSPEVLDAHANLADISLGAGRVPEGVRHLRAARFLSGLMAGRNHVGLARACYRTASSYYDAGRYEDALRLYELASGGGAGSSPSTERGGSSGDRMFDCLVARNSAGVLARLGRFKLAFDREKRAYQLYVAILGEEHEATKACSSTLIQLMRLAVEQEKMSKIKQKERVKEDAAEAVADQIRADEEAATSEKTKPKKSKKKKKGKK